MATSTSVMLNAVGPQVGYGMPFAGPYSNVYGTQPGAQAAQDQYWQSLNRGYENQQGQLQRDAFGRIATMGAQESYQLGNAVTYDPVTGSYKFDINKVPQQIRDNVRGGDAAIEAEYAKQLGDTNEDQLQARQQLEGLAQKRAAQAARTEQQQAEVAGFNKELARYQGPNLMAQMINPQIQTAGNQVMATANAAGMAGGSAGQAANRRAAMQGFGQGAANVVPGAAVAQAGQDFQWQKAREGMINNFYQQQQDRAQRDLSNEMNQALFLKGFEEYEHNRDTETLRGLGDVTGNVGAWGAQVAPFMKGGGSGGGTAGG